MSAVLLLLALGAPELPVAEPSDEARVRDLYLGEPNFERDWPVEFHIRVVEPLLEDLARAIVGLGNELSERHFVDDVVFGWGTPGISTPLPYDVERRTDLISPAARASRDTLFDTLRRHLADYQFVDHARVKMKDGHLEPNGHFVGHASIETTGREVTGAWRRDHGMLTIGFVRTPRGWRIERFEPETFVRDTSARRFFRDVTQHWLSTIPSAVRRRLVARSASDYIHEQIVMNLAPKDSRAQPVAMDAHPGVVVVDYDADGFDDLLVWDVLGSAVLLRNVEGRHFVDITSATGLDLERINGAAFSDLDNDGHLDVILAGWFRRTRIFFGGAEGFVDSKLVLPTEVATISIVDFDGDGDLDVFLGTAAHDHHARLAASGALDSSADANVDQIGPPNALFVNHGGRRFEDEAVQRGLAHRRNTLQAAFADFDEDGAIDVFLGNDFAPAHLLAGRDGRFVDVSRSTGADQIFFGMGATWGDVDGDGDLDLYVSAMKSSAGKRIMADQRRFDPSLTEAERDARHRAARGNTLLINEGRTAFRDATADPAFAAARNVGWSYGSQFIDADQDGWLDIYAPSGFFTSPLTAPEDTYRDL